MDNEFLKISVITPSYNQARFLSATIDSILSQKGNFFIDFIINDGASNDGSVDIIKSRFEKIVQGNLVKEEDGLTYYKSSEIGCLGVSIRWKSEKDSGQADAINKGFALAQGDILCWLHSDDVYASSTTLESVSEFFIANPMAKFVYGRGYKIKKEGKVLGEEHYVVDLANESIKEIDYILQPAAFWRKEIYQEFGPLNINYHFVLDWDYWVKISNKYKLYFLDKVLSCNRVYGETKTSSGHMKRYAEIIQFLIQNDSFTAKSLSSNVIIPEIQKEFQSVSILFRYSFTLSKKIKEEGCVKALLFLMKKLRRALQFNTSL